MVSLNGGRPFAESGNLKIAEPQNGSLKIFRILFSQFSQAQLVHANPLASAHQNMSSFFEREQPSIFGEHGAGGAGRPPARHQPRPARSPGTTSQSVM